MDRLNKKELQKMKVGKKIEQTQIHINNKDNKKLTIEDVKKIVASYEEGLKRRGDNFRIMVLGLNDKNMMTIKSFQGEIKLQNEEEYYNGIEEEDIERNFEEFYQIRLVIQREIK